MMSVISRDKMKNNLMLVFVLIVVIDYKKCILFGILITIMP
jgi:hypothetical protein